MTMMPAADEAAALAREMPRPRVGLHVVLTDEDGTERIDFDDPKRCREAIASQVREFATRVGVRLVNFHHLGNARP